MYIFPNDDFCMYCLCNRNLIHLKKEICTGTKDRNRTEKTWIVTSIYDSVQVMTQPKVELKITRTRFLQSISKNTNGTL